jgi:hypothetical protein
VRREAFGFLWREILQRSGGERGERSNRADGGNGRLEFACDPGDLVIRKWAGPQVEALPLADIRLQR